MQPFYHKKFTNQESYKTKQREIKIFFDKGPYFFSLRPIKPVTIKNPRKLFSATRQKLYRLYMIEM